MTFNYDADDPSGVHFALMLWANESGNQFMVYDFEFGYTPEGVPIAVPTDGRVERTLVDQLAPGHYELQYVLLSDMASNGIGYFRNGWMGWGGGEPAQHSVDLSALDFELRPWPYSFEDANGGGILQVDPDSGKFRFVRGDEKSAVFIAERTHILNGAVSLRYSDDAFSMVGTFHPAMNSFVATVRMGEDVYPLANGELPQSPVPGI